jgi:hypothetical protein
MFFPADAVPVGAPAPTPFDDEFSTFVRYMSDERRRNGKIQQGP